MYVKNQLMMNQQVGLHLYALSRVSSDGVVCVYSDFCVLNRPIPFKPAQFQLWSLNGGGEQKDVEFCISTSRRGIRAAYHGAFIL